MHFSCESTVHLVQYLNPTEKTRSNAFSSWALTGIGLTTSEEPWTLESFSSFVSTESQHSIMIGISQPDFCGNYLP